VIRHIIAYYDEERDVILMTLVHLVCPKCRNQDSYEKDNIDTSKEITCSACGFSDLPMSFELAKTQEKRSWQITKIGIMVIAGIAFVLVGLSVIVLAAFFVPVIIGAVILILLYGRWKDKKRSGPAIK
jgi:Zn ribbon nucleic-acid-binding protein